ncbi:MAG: hypothetical protein RL596_625 [Bacteroidota bacterium]|jgi:hypothetical protein
MLKSFEFSFFEEGKYFSKIDNSSSRGRYAIILHEQQVQFFEDNSNKDVFRRGLPNFT